MPTSNQKIDSVPLCSYTSYIPQHNIHTQLPATMDLHLTAPAKIEAFTTLFHSIKQITQNINIQFTAERMFIQTMDSARISILEVTLPCTWFNAYTCANPVTVGVHAHMLYKILSAAKKDHTIRIQYDADADALTIVMTTNQAANGSFEQQFTAPLMDIEEDTLDIPDMDYQVDMIMPSVVFSGMIQQLRNFGESLDIRCNETTNSWTAMTRETQERMSVNIKMDDLDEFAIDEACDLSLSFALTHLTYVSSYSKIAKNVYIKLHGEFPLRLDYPLEDDGMIRYYLAPKIGDNDA